MPKESWTEDEDEEEDRGHYEDTRAKGTVRRFGKRGDGASDYDDEEDSEPDDRDQFEDFELIT